MNERLLDEGELEAAIEKALIERQPSGSGYATIAKAQDAKTAAAKDAEYKPLVKVLQDITSYPTTDGVVHMFQMAAREALAQLEVKRSQPGIEPPTGVPEDQLPTPAEIRGIVRMLPEMMGSAGGAGGIGDAESILEVGGSGWDDITTVSAHPGKVKP